MPRDKRAPTQIEKYGFMDHDLKTPVHDAICMWIEDNAITIINQLGVAPTDEYLTEEEKDYLIRLYQSFDSSLGRSDEDMERDQEDFLQHLNAYKRQPFKIHKVTWEPVLTNDKKFEVGFLDMSIAYQRPEITIDSDSREIKTSYVTRTPDQKGFCRVWFEAKSKIPSLGELFRQLSFYKNHINSVEPIVVVSPDTRFKKRIESQGYYFIVPILEEKKEAKPATLFPTPKVQ